MGSLAALGLLAACAQPGQPTASGSATRPVVVFAASSLSGALPRIAALATDLDVIATFDGSPSLVDQLVAKPDAADVLVTADEPTMARAGGAGVVGPASVVATNRVVLVVPAGNPGRITGLDGSLAGRKLVVCAPSVPCGAAAYAIAGSAGVTLAPVSQEQKVADVRGKVVSGEADAGIVFATDARAAGAAVEVIALPGAERAVSRYPVVLVSAAPHREAGRAFVELLGSAAARRILADHGFGAP